MKKGLKNSILITLLLAIFLFPVLASAETDLSGQVMGQLQKGAETGGLGEPVAPQFVIINMIKFALGLFGSLFLALIVYGGLIYVQSSGREEEVQKGQKIITAAIIGLAIVLLSYSITLFVGIKMTGEKVDIQKPEASDDFYLDF
jgi:hypothetical protein